MTYNNPVFVEQCKLRKIEIDETGFVEQVPLDKKEKLLVEEVDEDDDDDFEDDDFDEDDIFMKKPSKPSLSKPDRPSFITDKDDDDNEVSFKIGGAKSTAKKTPPPIPVAPPPMTEEEEIELFGHKASNETPKAILDSKPPIRERMNKELKDVKPAIKLNVDKSDVASQSPNKPKIKLNIKPKQ